MGDLTIKPKPAGIASDESSSASHLPLACSPKKKVPIDQWGFCIDYPRIQEIFRRVQGNAYAAQLASTPPKAKIPERTDPISYQGEEETLVVGDENTHGEVASIAYSNFDISSPTFINLNLTGVDFKGTHVTLEGPNHSKIELPFKRGKTSERFLLTTAGRYKVTFSAGKNKKDIDDAKLKIRLTEAPNSEPIFDTDIPDDAIVSGHEQRVNDLPTHADVTSYVPVKPYSDGSRRATLDIGDGLHNGYQELKTGKKQLTQFTAFDISDSSELFLAFQNVNSKNTHVEIWTPDGNIILVDPKKQDIGLGQTLTLPGRYTVFFTTDPDRKGIVDDAKLGVMVSPSTPTLPAETHPVVADIQPGTMSVSRRMAFLTAGPGKPKKFERHHVPNKTFVVAQDGRELVIDFKNAFIPAHRYDPRYSSLEIRGPNGYKKVIIPGKDESNPKVKTGKAGKYTVIFHQGVRRPEQQYQVEVSLIDKVTPDLIASN